MRGILAFLGAILMTFQAHAAGGFFEDFKRIDPADWYVAEYQFNHPHFDTDWHAARVSAEAGLSLSLVPQAGQKNGYSGGSLRRHEETHYGRYEALIRPAKGEGVVTGFFTYTGPHYGHRHDEIDIEFLGKDTTQIHVATFVDGKLWNKFIDLGFDAADRPRKYAFEWRKDSIRWYVEDRLIFERKAADGPLPTVAGRLFANIWAADPSIKSWSGEIQPDTQAEAYMSEIRFTPLDDLPALASPDQMREVSLTQ